MDMIKKHIFKIKTSEQSYSYEMEQVFLKDLGNFIRISITKESSNLLDEILQIKRLKRKVVKIPVLVKKQEKYTRYSILRCIKVGKGNSFNMVVFIYKIQIKFYKVYN